MVAFRGEHSGVVPRAARAASHSTLQDESARLDVEGFAVRLSGVPGLREPPLLELLDEAQAVPSYPASRHRRGVCAAGHTDPSFGKRFGISLG